jgi:hypothetical protein
MLQAQASLVFDVAHDETDRVRESQSTSATFVKISGGIVALPRFRVMVVEKIYQALTSGSG